MSQSNQNPQHQDRQQHDGQKNYQQSNQTNRDNVRNDTRDHVYKEHETAHTNDQNFDLDQGQVRGDADYRDTQQNDDSENGQS